MHATPVDRTRLIVAAIAGLVGLVWLGQGIGLIPGSFMSSDPLWAALGALLIAGAAGYAVLPKIRSRGGTR